MKSYKNINELLNEICLDERVTNGVFDIFNDQHLEVLREKLLKMGLSLKETIEISNQVIEGKYPERQAYNSKGILVTFPNPEYKQRAIRRGTHFEEDPTKGQTNLDFSTPAQPVQEPTSPNEKPIQIEPAAQQPIQNDPISGTAQGQSGVATDDLETRTPDQKEKDAKEVEKILTTEFSLEEAKQNNWIKNKNRWYNSDGVLVGYEWYNVDSHKTTILSAR